MKKNKNSTRYFSSIHEKNVAKTIDGRVNSNSGATPFYKGDVMNEHFLFECKTVMTPQKSISIKKDWMDKLKVEKLGMGKSRDCLVFNFEPDGENYYILREKEMKEFLDLINMSFEEN